MLPPMFPRPTKPMLVRAAPTPAPSGGKRDPKHPELLLELADDLDEDVLRGEVDLAEAVHARTDSLGHVCEAFDERARGGVGVEGTRVDRIDAGTGVDGSRPAVRCDAQRDCPFGDGVRELAPGVDELVQVLVERLERAPVDVPVQLLADQRQVDELDERRLQLAAGLTAVVLVERRQVSFAWDGGHLSSFEIRSGAATSDRSSQVTSVLAPCQTPAGRGLVPRLPGALGAGSGWDTNSTRRRSLPSLRVAHRPRTRLAGTRVAFRAGRARCGPRRRGGSRAIRYRNRSSRPQAAVGRVARPVRGWCMSSTRRR